MTPTETTTTDVSSTSSRIVVLQCNHQTVHDKSTVIAATSPSFPKRDLTSARPRGLKKGGQGAAYTVTSLEKKVWKAEIVGGGGDKRVAFWGTRNFMWWLMRGRKWCLGYP